MATDYGVDLACFDDAPTPLFPTVTGLDLVEQDVYHRITNDSVIGWTIADDGSPALDPDAENYGKDARRCLGQATTEASAAALGPQFSAAIQRSGRIEFADVAVTRRETPGGIVVLTLAITGVAKQSGEAFSFVYHVTATTVSDTFPGAV
jgi:hypothetical protein